MFRHSWSSPSLRWSSWESPELRTLRSARLAIRWTVAAIVASQAVTAAQAVVALPSAAAPQAIRSTASTIAANLVLVASTHRPAARRTHRCIAAVAATSISSMPSKPVATTGKSAASGLGSDCRPDFSPAPTPKLVLSDYRREFGGARWWTRVGRIRGDKP